MSGAPTPLRSQIERPMPLWLRAVLGCCELAFWYGAICFVLLVIGD